MPQGLPTALAIFDGVVKHTWNETTAAKPEVAEERGPDGTVTVRARRAVEAHKITHVTLECQSIGGWGIVTIAFVDDMQEQAPGVGELVAIAAQPFVKWAGQPPRMFPTVAYSARHVGISFAGSHSALTNA